MHARNPSTCACMCHKDCEIGKYFKDCKCMKCLVDNIVVTCDEVVDTPFTIAIIKYYIKNELIIPCLLSY